MVPFNEPLLLTTLNLGSFLLMKLQLILLWLYYTLYLFFGLLTFQLSHNRSIILNHRFVSPNLLVLNLISGLLQIKRIDPRPSSEIGKRIVDLEHRFAELHPLYLLLVQMRGKSGSDAEGDFGGLDNFLGKARVRFELDGWLG